MENNQNKYLEKFIKPCIDFLYENEDILFKNDLSERCIVFRFAYQLQKKLSETSEYEEYLVDCDYNSRTEYDEESGECKRSKGKQIKDILMDRSSDLDEEKSTGRFIDLIVHKRSCNIDMERWSDLFCLEIKKWNNTTKDRMLKDRNNLEKLTTHYGYKFGFYLIFGEDKTETKIEVFQNGKIINKYAMQ